MNEQGSGPAKVAVIWDFDGTLVNSHPRNLSVNRAIVEEVTDRSHECFPALVSIAAYEAAVARASDWREFYASEFGLGEDEIERASALWSRLQLSDATPQSPFEGIGEALAALQDLPLGILSQNDSVVIRRALEHAGLLWRFDTVLGYGELPRQDRKPAGGGLLSCIAALGLAPDSRVFFVGDHVTDAMCAADARKILGERGEPTEVVSVAAHFGTTGFEDWPISADHVVRTPSEIVALVRNPRLPSPTGARP